MQFALSVLALGVIAACAWYALVEMETAMRVMSGDGPFTELMWRMMRPADALPYLTATSVMWIVMMIAMMVPAVIPMLIVFHKLERTGSAGADTFLFASGYLLAWSAFSVVAALMQWLLHRAGWLGGDVLAAGVYGAAAILVAAGIYQLTPAKDACLDKCRSPMGYFLHHWRDGRIGAVVMGLRHGLFCIGCCWMLMALMFVGGAMSVATMAIVAAMIVAERVLPAGPLVTKVPGFLLVAVGLALPFLA